MNTIFDKNLDALKIKNPKLADKLSVYILSDVPQLVQTNSFYNLLYKNIYLHNQNNPLGEANEIFNLAENNPAAIHLIYGLGLGYLFQVASINSLGTVILYEPDLNILRTSMALVDFSNDILKKNVYITDSIDEAEEYIYIKSNTNNSPLLLSTVSYRELSGNKFEELVVELQKIVGMFGLDRKYTQERFFPLLQQIITNIPNLVNDAPLTALKDIYKGKTAVVVSAGPTLDRNIETIKKYRQNIVLIVVGTAMKSLVSNNIIPDFLCIIESRDCSKQIEGVDLSNVNFVTEPFVHQNLIARQFKNTFLHISSNCPVNDFWCNLSKESNNEYLSKGTVSYTAINVARILGCSKIVMVGQDLAYIEGQCYSKTSAYKDLKLRKNEQTGKIEIVAEDFDNFARSLANSDSIERQRELAQERLDMLNGALYYVKGIQGDKIPTESVYATFIRPLSDFTKNFPDHEYINTSMVGAQIDGYKNIPLEEALKDSSPINKRELTIDYKIDKNYVKEQLFKSKEDIKSTLLMMEELQKKCKNLKNNINRYRNISAEILKDFKKIMTGYTVLSVDYAAKIKLFDYITVSERIDVDYEIKMAKEIKIENVAQVTDKVLIYAQKGIEKINQIVNKIEDILEVI